MAALLYLKHRLQPLRRGTGGPLVGERGVAILPVARTTTHRNCRAMRRRSDALHRHRRSRGGRTPQGDDRHRRADQAVRPAEFERVIVDTTVQEKAIAHPVDSRLLEIARAKIVQAAKRVGIALKQTFVKEARRCVARPAATPMPNNSSVCGVRSNGQRTSWHCPARNQTQTGDGDR